MKLELNIKNTENMKGDLKKYEEIITALISSGGLDGVKGGQTIIHFDGDSQFMGIQLSYWPWRKRKIY